MSHTLLLVEDDPLTRMRLARVLATDSRLQLIGEVGSLAEAVTLTTSHAPELMLLDLGLPDGNGLDLIPLALQVGARVIILSVFADGPKLRSAQAAGASGCLLKDSSASEILAAISRFLPDPQAVATAEITNSCDDMNPHL